VHLCKPGSSLHSKMVFLNIWWDFKYDDFKCIVSFFSRTRPSTYSFQLDEGCHRTEASWTDQQVWSLSFTIMPDFTMSMIGSCWTLNESSCWNVLPYVLSSCSIRLLSFSLWKIFFETKNSSFWQLTKFSINSSSVRNLCFGIRTSCWT